MKEELDQRAENAAYRAPGEAAYVASHTAGVVTRRISWGAIIGGTIIALVTANHPGSVPLLVCGSIFGFAV